MASQMDTVLSQERCHTTPKQSEGWTQERSTHPQGKLAEQSAEMEAQLRKPLKTGQGQQERIGSGHKCSNLKHSASFQGLEDSTYQQENSELEQPSLSKSIPSANNSSEDTSQTSLFMVTSDPLIQQEESGRFYLEDFPVMEPATLVFEKDSEMSVVSCGGKCSESSVSLAQDLSSSKTQKVCDIEGLPKLSTTLPATGMWGNGSVYQLPTLKRPIYEKESLLLPTPTASDGEGKNYRPAGGNKLTEKLKRLNLLPNSQVLNAEVVELMQGFPMDWTSLSGSSLGTQISTCSEDKCLDELSFLSVPRSPSEGSSTSTPSCKNFPFTTEDEQLCENFPKPGKAWIDPHEIDLCAGTQSRDRTDWETVQRYTELMQENLWDWERGPLPVIFQDRFGRKYPGDCHHRTEAAIKAGVDLICVDLRKGTLIDAIMHSCEAKANREHGLPLTAKDQRRRIELFLDTRDRLPESDERRRYSTREVARYLGLADSGYRTVCNVLSEREMLGKISQFASGDRVQVVRNPAAGSGGYWPDGTLGKVQSLDKKKGILVVPDTAAHLDRWMLSHGWIHPDNLIKSDAPWLSGQISQDEEMGRHEALGTDSGSALPPQPLVGEPKSRDKQLLPDVNRNGDVPPTAEKPAPAALVNQVAIANGKPDVVAAEIAIGIKHLNPEGLLHVIEAIAHHVGAEVLSNLLVESIYKNEVAGLCNKCLGAMDKRAFSWMEVEKINFTGLSDSALKLLVKESKRALNERYHPEYFNGRHCGSTQSRKSASSTSAPAICCGCGEDTDDEDLTLGVPGGDDEEAL